MIQDMEELKKKIKELQTQLKELEDKEQYLKEHPLCWVAEEMHSVLCHRDHCEGCDWLYCTWENYAPNSSRARYLEVARKFVQQLVDQRKVYIDDTDAAVELIHTLKGL